MLVSSSILCVVSIAYFQSQFDVSSTMVLYKEIAEDCYPSAICDTEDQIHVVWQSDRKGNWDIYYTHLESYMQKQFISLTVCSQDEQFPSTAKDEKGNIWVVWITNESNGGSIRGKILQDNKLWSEEKKFVSADDECEKKSPCLISIGPDKMLIAWIEKGKKTQEIRYTICNDSTGPSKLLSLTNNARKVILGETKTGKIFALWDSMSMGKSNLYFSLFDEEREIFPECGPLLSVTGEPFVGDTPTIVTRSEGPGMLFFRDETWNILFSSEIIQEKAEGFPMFSEPSIFGETGALEDYPEVISTNKREIYLFWTSNYTGDSEIFFCHNPDEHFVESEIQYEKVEIPLNEKAACSVKNLTLDPNQVNSNPYGYFCDDIFFSVAVIGDELWVTWDSYHWDLVEPNNARQIRYMKTLDGYQWEQPVTVVDSIKSKKNGRDDRHPTVTGTEDGRIWIFWHTDRFRTNKESNFDICYILSEDGGKSWIWKVEDEDPFLLTGDLGNDMCPSVSSIQNRILVVWQSDRRSGNFDIFFCEFDGENWSSVQCIANEDAPERNPSITTHGGWHLASLGSVENIAIAWESKEEDCYMCHFSTLASVEDIPHIENQMNIDTRFPSACYVTRHTILRRILPNDLWLVWQCSEHGSRTSNILCKNRNNEKQITDDFSHNERPQIIEFKEKIWIFWDSTGGGNGRGIYYKSMSKREIPFWLSTYSYIIAVSWVLFFLDIRSKGGVRKQVLELSKWIDNLFTRHIGLRDVLIGVAASILTYVILQFLGMSFGYFFG